MMAQVKQSIKKMRKEIKRILSRVKITSRFFATRKLFSKNSYLQKTGWFRSFADRMPVDSDGKPIPWYTYTMISFLEKRIRADFSVFEYGSGNSTFWWSTHVSRVMSCEHDLEWYQRMKSKLPPNIEYVWYKMVPGGEYSSAIKKYNHKFQIIVIDGRDRVNCIKKSLSSLTDDGVVIWDNSDRKEYCDGYDYLISNGFKRLDFEGMNPINAHLSCTSVFYRGNNCLDI